MEQETKKITRQQKRQNARLEAKRLAKRAGKKFRNVSRKKRRQFAFDITTVQLSRGIRKGTEYKSLDEEFENIGTGRTTKPDADV